jgi:hypothetical protein
MPVKTDGTLYAKTLKDRQVPDSKRVEAPGAPTGRFIGTGDLAGWDTSCRILEVTDAGGSVINDAVDAGKVGIVIQPLQPDEDHELHEVGPQLKVGYDEGYFLDIVGPVPAGLPTSEHVPVRTGLDHLTQTHLADLPAAHQPFQPGQPALAALARAGEHGDPLPVEEKELRADVAEWQRVYAARLSEHPEDIDGAIAAANDATGLNMQPAVVEQPPEQPASPEELQAAHTRIFQAELEATPDQPHRALQAANDATGLQVQLADVQEPQREDV